MSTVNQLSTKFETSVHPMGSSKFDVMRKRGQNLFKGSIHINVIHREGR